MESENKNPFQRNINVKDVNLAAAAARARYKKLTLTFKLFFFALTLIIGALIIYLVQDIASDSHSDPSVHLNYPPTHQTFDTQSLERAAEELEDITSLILHKYLASNTETTPRRLALKVCRISLLKGSGQIRRALGANQVITMDRIEDCVKECLDDLEKVESTAVSEVRAKVLRAMVHLRDSGDFLGEKIWQKKISSAIGATRALVLENLFLVCIGGLELPFVILLLWAYSKFR